MKSKEKIRKMRGITLVSLVVTIIVLIILAGVSINLTLGENGIITMAKKARENMELAKTDEERQLNELYAQIVTEGGSSGNASDEAIIKLAEFKREIASALTDIGIETADTADITIMASNIRSLTGASSADKVSYDNTNSELTSTNLQGAVDEIDTSVDELNNNLKWKLLGSITGKEAIQLQDVNYNELLIIVEPYNATVRGTKVINRNYLSEDELIFGVFCGITSNGNIRAANIGISRASIKMLNVYINTGNEVGENSTMLVYYR